MPKGKKRRQIHPASCASCSIEGIAQNGDSVSHAECGLSAQGAGLRGWRPGYRWRWEGVSAGEHSPPWLGDQEVEALETESRHGRRPKGVKSWAETECVHGYDFEEVERVKGRKQGSVPDSLLSLPLLFQPSVSLLLRAPLYSSGMIIGLVVSSLKLTL